MNEKMKIELVYSCVPTGHRIIKLGLWAVGSAGTQPALPLGCSLPEEEKHKGTNCIYCQKTLLRKPYDVMLLLTCTLK